MSKYYKEVSKTALAEQLWKNRCFIKAALRKCNAKKKLSEIDRGGRECEEKEAEGSATEGSRAHARRDRGAVCQRAAAQPTLFERSPSADLCPSVEKSTIKFVFCEI